MPGRFAVVIGINYATLAPGLSPEIAARAGLNRLQYAEADATALATQLQQDGYAVRLLLGASATCAKIFDEMSKCYAGRSREDLILFYFSGHGNAGPSDGYLLPSDADPANLPASAISLTELAGFHTELDCSTLVLLDCCHSGYAVKLKGHAIPDDPAGEFGQQVCNRFAHARGQVVLAACARDQQARELPWRAHGAFTYHALEYWRATPGGEAMGLYQHIVKGIKQERIKLPEPVFSGVQEGLMLLRSSVVQARSTLGELAAPKTHSKARQDIYELLASLGGPGLEQVCFALTLDYLPLKKKRLDTRIRYLITEMENADRFDELIRAAQKVRRQLARSQRTKKGEVKPPSKSTAASLDPLTGPTASVTSLAFTSASRADLLACGSMDGTVWLWRVTQTERSFERRMAAKGQVNSLAFAPKSHILAIGSRVGVELWQPSDQRPRDLGPLLGGLFSPLADVHAVAFSPDGVTLAVAAGSSTLRLYWADTNKARHPLGKLTSPVFSLAFSPDGQTLASAAENGEISLWSVKDGVQFNHWRAHHKRVASLIFTPDGQTIISGSLDGTIGHWQASNGGLIQQWQAHTGTVRSLALASQGEILISGSMDGSVRLWQLSEYACVATLIEHGPSIHALAFSQNRRMLAAGSSDGFIRLWKLP